MKKTKMEKGITLIALIITIVVLLILAVVSIGTIRESSIITHAQNAKEDWENESTKEEIELKLAELKIDMGVNPDKYKFIMEQDDSWQDDFFDDGSIKEIFDSVELTINSSQLDGDKFKFVNLEENLVPEGEYFICNYDINCANKNNKEIKLNFQFKITIEEVEEESIFNATVTKINLVDE